MKKIRATSFRVLAALVAAFTAAIGLTNSAQAVPPQVDIYELYGAGGNSGSVLNADYAVLYNHGSVTVDINGWSLQYASLTGTTWTPVNLTNAAASIPIPPGGYFCVAFSNPTNLTGSPYLADYTNTAINMAAGGGKLALLTVTNKLTGANPVGNANLVDLVGAAGANGYEGSAPAGAMSATTILRRLNAGCTDTDNNTNDFTVVTITSVYQPAYSGFPTNSCSSINPPTIYGVTPAAATNNAGTTANFAVAMSGGDAPLTNYWYLGSVSPANFVSSSTNPVLTLANVSALSAGNYIVVVSNASGLSATSSPVTLVVNDPAINIQPENAQGLLGETVRFAVTAGGAPLAYQWYYSDTNGNLMGALSDAVNTYSTSVNSGSGSATLSISGLTANDPTNFLVIVSNTANHLTVTSSVVSLVSVTPTAMLAFWNFNGTTSFSNNIPSPPTYYGVGTASVVGASAQTGVADADDGPGNLPPLYLGGSNNSWGTVNYATQGTSNKQYGVQFMTSTVGAQHIRVGYDARGTGTASAYERVQYTTDGGSTWIDYPATTSFGTGTLSTTIKTTAQGVTGYATSTFASFTNDLSGFPGVDNNPNFGIRILTEWESTATYGASPNVNYYGIGNNYAPGGTLTYDIVAIWGDSITNNSAAPTIGALTNATVNDFQTITVDVPVNDTANPASSLVLSAMELDTATPAPTVPNPNYILALLSSPSSSFSFGGSGTARTMTIMPNQDHDGVAPVLVTATDPVTGLSAVSWFYLTVLSLNGAPTNTLALNTYPGTNTQYNIPVSIPFSASDDHTAPANLSYSAVSSNQAVLPSANVTFNTTTPGSPIAIITPGSSPLAVGLAPVSVTVTDNGITNNSIPGIDIRSTTATFPVEILPNTNVVLIDYFNYDNSGPLNVIGAGLWTHLSGNGSQIQVGGVNPGFATINTLANTENLQAKLLGAPYSTNSPAVLYASFIVNVDPSNPPRNNGTYFAVFNDGSGTTGNYADRIMVATNGAAAGYYRFIANNGGADALTGVAFPQDLALGSNYVVVTGLVVSNGWSTIWINPSSPSSPSVTDTTPVAQHFNISDFELRSSGGDGGVVSISKLKVGTTFDSVLPSLQVALVGPNAVVTAPSDPTLGIQASTNNVLGPYTAVAPNTPYTNAVAGTNAVYYRFSR